MARTNCLDLNGCGCSKRVWALIPARGGSVGVPRKNLISCAGRPLIQHVIETAKKVICAGCVVVITDSLEIAEFARTLGVQVIQEKTPSGSDETLDEKIHRNLRRLRGLGAEDASFLLTLQPTSPLTTTKTIRSAISQLDAGFTSTITVANDPHLRWGIDRRDSTPVPRFEERKNRQQLPEDYRETGGVIGVRLGDLESSRTRILQPVGLVVVDEREAIDIDSFGHLYEAEHWLTRGKVLFRVEANQLLGTGHIYRCLSIAYELSRHEVLFVYSDSSPLVEKVIRATPFQFLSFTGSESMADIILKFGPDLIFLDILDTDVNTVARLRTSAPQARIVTFENDGAGAQICDLGVYDLTVPQKTAPPLVLTGPHRAILGPSFELFRSLADSDVRARPLLLTFGGTDPARLTQKVLLALNSIQFTGKVTVVLGLGASEPRIEKPSFEIDLRFNVTNMALLMSQHRLAISSMGRTVFELSAMGVPSLAFSQNEKEDNHAHIGQKTGSLLGGKGYKMTYEEIASQIERFLGDQTGYVSRRREAEAYRMGRSNSAVVEEILNKVGLRHLNSRLS